MESLGCLLRPLVVGKSEGTAFVSFYHVILENSAFIIFCFGFGFGLAT